MVIVQIYQFNKLSNNRYCFSWPINTVTNIPVISLVLVYPQYSVLKEVYDDIKSWHLWYHKCQNYFSLVSPLLIVQGIVEQNLKAVTKATSWPSIVFSSLHGNDKKLNKFQE